MTATGADPPSFLAVMASINNWFKVNRAKAIGISMLGLGIGGVVFPPLLAFGLNNFSWREVSTASGIFIIVVGIFVSLLVRFNPESYGYSPDGIDPNETADSSSVKVNSSGSNLTKAVTSGG